jgi:hypothetical protein
VSTKFLCLQIDNHINWKNHIEEMVPKLSGACYVVRSMIHISNINTQINLLHMLSFCYEIRNNLGGNSSNSENTQYTIQQKIIRIITAAQPITSYRSLIFNI